MNIKAQSITGVSGLFTIPSAEIMNDREFSIGINHYPRKYLETYVNQYDALIFYMTGSYLPFLEVSIRSTYLYAMGNHAIGDRMVSFRVQIIKQRGSVPNITFGIHDFTTVFGGIGAIYFNALYLVATENILINSYYINKLGVTIGFGSDLMEAKGHEFVGLFGGLSFRMLKYFDLILEYDAQKTNIGLKAKMLSHIQLIFGVLGLKSFAGGINYSLQL